MGDLAKGLVTSLLGTTLTQTNAVTTPSSSAVKPEQVSAGTLALFDTGLAQMDRKDFEGAVETFKKVLTQTPGFAPAERNIRTSLEKLSMQ
jgi:outer membrane protein assembly factor BamD (BamD/ComL family)